MLGSLKLGKLGRSSIKGLNIAALFAAQPGRNGFFFGNSYDELIAQNNSALGPELFTGAWGAPSFGTLTDLGGGRYRLTSTSVATVGLIASSVRPRESVRAVFTLSSNPASVNVSAYGRGVSVGTTSAALGMRITGGSSTNSTEVFSIFFTATGVGQSIEFEAISVRAADYSRCVLFDDTSGTVPIFSALQTSRGRGLLLDKSKASSWGSELCADGAFSAQGAWVLGSGAVISGGVLSLPTLSTSNAQYPIATEVGRVYRVTATASANSFCGAWASLGQSGVLSDINGVSSSTSRTASIAFTFKAAGTTSYVVFTATGSTTPTIDNVSVVAMPLGNHLVQSTAAARGEFSRRYNQFLSTDDISSAAWTKEAGTATAKRFTPSTASALHRIAQSLGAVVVAGTVFTFALRLRNEGVQYVYVNANANLGVAAVVNLNTAAFTGSGANWSTSGFTATLAADGWVDVKFSGITPGTGVQIYIQANDTFTVGDRTYVGDGTSGFGVDRVDLRFTADAIASIPIYQRVATATDYDEVGFPAYHREQTDDSGSVKQLNPAGATKSLVAWAGQKMSDAVNYGTLLETSGGWATTNGNLVLYGPGAAATDPYRFGSRGTGSAAQTSLNTAAYPAPNRAIVMGVADINADTLALNLNGVQVATSALDQGTGQYTTQDVWMGGRSGSSLFANTRTFAPPMLMFMQPADPGLSASQLTAIQRRFAKAAGVTI